MKLLKKILGKKIIFGVRRPFWVACNQNKIEKERYKNRKRITYG